MNRITKYIKENKLCSDIVVEIGVAEGINAHSILSNLNIKKIYLIDSYLPCFDKGKKTTRYMGLYYFAVKRLDEYKDKIIFLKYRWEDVIDKIPDNIDYFYYDAMGTEKSMLECLYTFYPKIKKGGVLSSRYYDRINYPFMVDFIDDFASKHDKDLFIDFKDNYWMLIKC